MESYRVVGKSVVKKDGWSKVSGEAKYADDLYFPEMLHAFVVRGNLAHAAIKGFKTEEAAAQEGVAAVLTGKDVPGRNGVGIVFKDEPVLVMDKVRRIGDPLALIAAETREMAESAAAKVVFNFDELPSVHNASEAMAPGAPLVHKSKNNIAFHRKIRKGSFEDALKQADVVIEKTYRLPFVEHAAIEPESCVALRDGDSITVWASTQNPHFDRDEVAAVMDLNLNRVRVIQQYTGGGFGGKLDISTQCHAALLAWHTKRPVKLTYTREESFIVTSKRHPCVIDYTTAASGDGKILGVKVFAVADTGAYASYGPGVVSRMTYHAAGPYDVPNVCVDAYGVYTNNPYCGAMRGFGVPQVGFAHETQIELVAEALKMDSWAIRLKNALRAGSQTATLQTLNQSVGIVETIEEVRRHLSMQTEQSAKEH